MIRTIDFHRRSGSFEQREPLTAKGQSMIDPIARASCRRGASLLLEVLSDEGVDYIFGNPGTTELPLIDALTGTASVSYILALQEASAVAMADGYAQASGRTGFLNLHTAGGLGHGMGNLLNANISHTPLVVTVGQQDTRHLTSDPLLAGDIVGVGAPAVKWAAEVTSVDELGLMLRRAFNDAGAAPSGPVMLSIPMNILEEETASAIPDKSLVDRRSIAGSLEPLAAAICRVGPGKLAIIAGDEIHASDASCEVVALAERLGAPVFGSSWPSRIPFPTVHPLWSGNLPTTAVDIANVLSGFDAVLALGGKSLITILYSPVPAVPPGCAVFQMSADGGDLGRTYATELSVFGDLRASLGALLPMLPAKLADTAAARVALVDDAGRRRVLHRAQVRSDVQELLHQRPIAPLVAASETVRAIGGRVPIVDEAIATSLMMRDCLESDRADQYSFLRGGALGWGMPAAVGCSLGIGREPVVCTVGDGAALYSPQALWTAARERLPVTFVVMNNREYNVLKNFLRRQPGYCSADANGFVAMDLINPCIDYVSMAQGFGVPGRRVEHPDEIGEAIQQAVASGQPNLIEILIGS
jgi:benzoylformate decarboxylase